MDKNVNVVINYLEKYLEQNKECSKLLEKMVAAPNFEESFDDAQWDYIIDQAWQLAYKQAMEDNYISPEERRELANINQIGQVLKNNRNNRVALNAAIISKFRKLHEIEDKDEELREQYQENTYRPSYPKLTPPNPFDEANKKKDKK
jgi:hypothetical protein